MPERKFIHIDMDAFFAAIEQRDNPKLQGKPVVVGADPKGRGVVCAASYEARKFGVHSAMPIGQAYQRCPQAIFLKPDFQKYVAVSKQLQALFHEVTDLVEPLSLDEAFLDVTENKLREPSAKKIAIYLKSRIKGSLGLTASAGVAPVKFVAKIASDLEKPNGLVVVTAEQLDAFVARLPVERLWSVGPVTAQRLHAMGIRTAGDVRQRSLKDLEKVLGKHGGFIYQLAHGVDERGVETDVEAKSRGSEETFQQDVQDLNVLIQSLEPHVQEISAALKKRGVKGKVVTLKLRYDDFTTITRQRTLRKQTNDPGVILEAAVYLLTHTTQAGNRPVRLVGVSVSDFENRKTVEQLPLDL